jgi:hypothetical protein
MYVQVAKIDVHHRDSIYVKDPIYVHHHMDSISSWEGFNLSGSRNLRRSRGAFGNYVFEKEMFAERSYIQKKLLYLPILISH